jgi:hypothetical protein
MTPEPLGRSLSDFTVELDVYSGPYEWLLALILKDELEIFEIPLRELVESYLLARRPVPPRSASRSTRRAGVHSGHRPLTPSCRATCSTWVTCGYRVSSRHTPGSTGSGRVIRDPSSLGGHWFQCVIWGNGRAVSRFFRASREGRHATRG